MAAGAGLPVLAIAVTAGHLLIVLCFAPLAARLPGSTRVPVAVKVDYTDGHGVLRVVLARCTGLGYAVLELATDQHHDPHEERAEYRGVVTVRLLVQSRQPVTHLAAALSELDGVHAVSSMSEALD
jgi:putative Mg2+ transporter-C (MgtC) family protein